MRKTAFTAISPLILGLLTTLAMLLIPHLCPSTSAAPATAAGAQMEGAAGPSDSRSSLPISLEQSVMLALENNKDLQVERLTPLIQEEEVRKEAGVFFSPRLNVEASTDHARKPSGSVLAGAQVLDTSDVDINSGISMRSITGGIISLDFRNKRFETNSIFQSFDPQYTADLALSVRHPLIKNFGPGLNGIRIKVARNNVDISKHQLHVVVANLVADVQQAYWDLVLATHDLAARRRALEVAQYLEKRAEEMVAGGRLPALAIIQAKTAALERDVDVTAGENSVEDAQSHLKALLNLARMPTLSNLTLVPTDPVRFEARTVAIAEGIKSALANRPELSQAKLDQENRRLGVQFARNQLLPEVNFVGSIGLSGLSGTPTTSALSTITVDGVPVSLLVPFNQNLTAFQGGYDKALDKMFSGDFLAYKVGLSVQVPLGNQVARSELAKARLEVEKSKATFETLEQKITLEVEHIARALSNSLKAIEGARSLRALSQQQLKMAQDGLGLGASSVTDVIEAQKNLTFAQRDELKAIIAYNKMLVLWDKVTGTVLERFHISL